MDLNFEQMLATHNQEFKEAEVFDNWMPPVGLYVISVDKFSCGQGSKNDPDFGWWKLTCKIEVESSPTVDEKLGGKTFTVFYSTKAPGIFKGAARILSGNGSLNDLTEAHEVIENSPGLVANVEILITTAKNGKDYKNCYFREVINTTAEPVSDTAQAPIEEAQAVAQEAVEVSAEIPTTVPDDDIPF